MGLFNSQIGRIALLLVAVLASFGLGRVTVTVKKAETSTQLTAVPQLSQESSDRAVAAVTAAVDRKEWQAGYDAFLVALRISPGDPAVFSCGIRLIEEARKDMASEEAEAIALEASEKLESCLPFMDIGQVPSARIHLITLERHFAGREEKISTLPKEVVARPFEDLDKIIAALGDKIIPVSVRARLAQEAEADLAIFGKQAASGTPVDWLAVSDRKQKVDAAQKAITQELFEASGITNKIEQWKQKMRAYVKEVDADGIAPDPARRDAEIAREVAYGQALTRELMPFNEAEIPKAVEYIRANVIETEISYLIRIREWTYNRWVFHHLTRVLKIDDPFEVTKELSVIDDSRLIPWVSDKVADSWKNYFEKCNEEQKVEAMKLRIMRGFKP